MSNILFAGIAIGSVPAKYSKILNRMIEKNEIGQFGLNVEDLQISLFFKLESHKGWLQKFIRNQSPSKPIWTRGDKIKIKKRNQDEKNFGVHIINYFAIMGQIIMIFIVLMSK